VLFGGSNINDADALATGTYYFTQSVNGCESDRFALDVIVNTPLDVVFPVLADVCVAAGVQTGLGGASPMGGTYSGSGVTDDGNGMTFTFDPAIAGVDTVTVTYTYTSAQGCVGSATSEIMVTAEPTLSFTGPGDFCIDAGSQAGIGGASPAGGIFSGSGVTDNGNGSTFDFDPATAGVGTHTITYTFDDGNGCTDVVTDTIQVFDLPIDTVTTTPTTLTADQTGASYQWIDCDTNLPVPGETNQSFSPGVVGNFKVEITLNGCTVESTCENFLSTSQFDLSNFKYYPNPTVSILNIEYSQVIDKVTITNMLGQVVNRIKTNSTSVQVDLGRYSRAAYFITVESGNLSHTFKVLKD